MSVLSVGMGNYDTSAILAAKQAGVDSMPQKAAGASDARKPDMDTFVKSSDAQKAESAAAETKRLNSDEIRRLQEQRTESFNRMLNDIVNTQANHAKKAGLAKNGLTKDLFSDLVVTPDQKLAAQNAIGEDGEWGVNAVATRIMDLCVSLSGGDASKIEEMRAAVDKGFQQAAGQWGSSLPSICGQTHDEINKRFDYWKEKGSLDGYEYQKMGIM